MKTDSFEDVIHTVVSYAAVAVSLNLLLYCVMNNFRYDCVI